MGSLTLNTSTGFGAETGLLLAVSPQVDLPVVMNLAAIIFHQARCYLPSQ